MPRKEDLSYQVAGTESCCFGVQWKGTGRMENSAHSAWEGAGYPGPAAKPWRGSASGDGDRVDPGKRRASARRGMYYMYIQTQEHSQDSEGSHRHLGIGIWMLVRGYNRANELALPVS